MFLRGASTTMTTWPEGRQTPDNNLMRFVSERFPFYVEIMLDIGCGEGANARELSRRRHMVFSIDKDPNVKPPVEETPGWHRCVDVHDYHFKGPFDLIYDVNTLCHVEDPPLEKIKNGLGPSGVFFSICPQFGSCTRVMKGKKFTRFLTLKDVRNFYEVFRHVKVGSSTYRLPGGEMYASWLVEGRP